MTFRSARLIGAAVAALALPAMIPATALAQDPAAVQAAQDGYDRLNRGDTTGAAQSAARAVTLAPDSLDYRLLWADALLRGGRHAEALDALAPVSGVRDYRVQSRIAEAATGAGRTDQAARAFALAGELAPEAGARAYAARAEVQALLQAGRRDEAARAFDAAWALGVLPADDPANAAMLAVAVGDDARALDAFARAEARAPLTGATALDAAYTAKRAGRDADAVRWFRQGLNSLPSNDHLSPQRRHEIGREIETLERRGGFNATLEHGPVSTLSSGGGGEDVTQAGAEAYWRVGGYRNGRPLDVFVRAYGTLDAPAGYATGGDSVQGWVGARWKPFAATNLVLEASRMVAIGDAARDDTMLRAAWSAEAGGDLRYDADSWTSWRLYGDLAHMIDADQTLGVLDGQVGRTWRAGSRDLFTLGLGATVWHDSALADDTSVGAGPRLNWRRWFNAREGAAPGSYIDLGLGYDADISGDRGGLKVRLSLVY
ncbi:MAG: hypothetical protein KF910_10910 [Brevundimonas sp.]|uniref:NfrA family protein n=1 Tax=Brevundimonas sp. TaxID=1871086 RepID=UPI0025BC0E69|nr:hypothetical protein [Brevundimonas sp.]MBX3478112.1 hypothetical protein [Brevundimonas sp.]